MVGKRSHTKHVATLMWPQQNNNAAMSHSTNPSVLPAQARNLAYILEMTKATSSLSDLATQTWRYAKITQKLENLLELDTNAVQQKTRPRLDTGLAKCGKEIQCLTKGLRRWGVRCKT